MAAAAYCRRFIGNDFQWLVNGLRLNSGLTIYFVAGMVFLSGSERPYDDCLFIVVYIWALVFINNNWQ